MRLCLISSRFRSTLGSVSMGRSRFEATMSACGAASACGAIMAFNAMSTCCCATARSFFLGVVTVLRMKEKRSTSLTPS